MNDIDAPLSAEAPSAGAPSAGARTVYLPLEHWFNPAASLAVPRVWLPFKNPATGEDEMVWVNVANERLAVRDGHLQAVPK